MCPSDPWQATHDQHGRRRTPASSSTSRLAAAGHLDAAVHQLRGLPGDVPRDLATELRDRPSSSQYNGVIYNDSHVSIAAITDGTSNTFLFGERAQTLFAKNLGPDLSELRRLVELAPLVRHDGGDLTSRPTSPVEHSSMHELRRRLSPSDCRRACIPAASTSAFCDGSVRFIKNSISSWEFQPGTGPFYNVSLPVGVTYTNYIFTAHRASPSSASTRHSPPGPKARSSVRISIEPDHPLCSCPCTPWVVRRLTRSPRWLEVG